MHEHTDEEKGPYWGWQAGFSHRKRGSRYLSFSINYHYSLSFSSHGWWTILLSSVHRSNSLSFSYYFYHIAWVSRAQCWNAGRQINLSMYLELYIAYNFICNIFVLSFQLTIFMYIHLSYFLYTIKGAQGLKKSTGHRFFFCWANQCNQAPFDIIAATGSTLLACCTNIVPWVLVKVYTS